MPRTTLLALCLVSIPAVGARADEGEMCAAVSARNETVIAFRPPSSFAICRHGRELDDVMVGDAVHLELLPTALTDLYLYRVGGGTVPGPSGLSLWSRHALAAADVLDALANSSLPVSAIPPPPWEAVPGDGATRALVAARQLYLGVVTDRFYTGLSELTGHLSQLEEMSAGLSSWCRHIAAKEHLSTRMAEQAAERCTEEAMSRKAYEDDLAALQLSMAEFRGLRDRARTALLDDAALPSPKAAALAIETLVAGRSVAERIVELAARLGPASRRLARNAAVLRVVLRSFGALKAGEPVLLARYDRPGNAVLDVEGLALDLVARGNALGREDPTPEVEPVHATFHFSVLDTHFLDLTLGLAYTGGAPDRPTISTVNGNATVTSQPVDEFVALLLAELEPLRFVWPDKPLAGLLRFPVVGIPLTRDPTQNFFVGAGIGWSGVASLDFGPYLLREAVLAPGVSYGQTVPSGTSVNQVTNANLQVGYFVSANIDLLGLYHFFVRPQIVGLDAATGAPR